ncbi:MAG: hypothetical protein ACJASL_001677 [Paraglaciecola sp.]|jgi:hypothetical protein
MDMKKFLLISFLSMFIGSQAQAGFISLVTGADMGGIKVTGNQANGSSFSAFWVATGANSGEATVLKRNGNFWTLSQVGDSIVDGNPDPLAPTGFWTLTTVGINLTSLVIEGTFGGIVFDTLFGNANVNGSGDGREFSTDSVGTNGQENVFAGFTDPYMGQPDLFSTMTLTGTNGRNNDRLINAGTTINFAIDTDAVVVSAPATASILMLSILGLVMNARRKQA